MEKIENIFERVYFRRLYVPLIFCAGLMLWYLDYFYGNMMLSHHIAESQFYLHVFFFGCVISIFTLFRHTIIMQSFNGMYESVEMYKKIATQPGDDILLKGVIEFMVINDILDLQTSTIGNTIFQLSDTIENQAHKFIPKNSLVGLSRFVDMISLVYENTDLTNRTRIVASLYKCSLVSLGGLEVNAQIFEPVSLRKMVLAYQAIPIAKMFNTEAFIRLSVVK